MEWSKEYQQQLLEYIVKYNESLGDMTIFFSQIDWNHLSRQFRTNNIEFLKYKVDEIFDSLYFRMDKDVLNVTETFNLWNNRNKLILRDVEDMLDALKLQSFEVQEEPRSTNMAMTASSRSELPKLTKTERRMSLDLLKLKPRGLSESGIHRELNRTKPAAASTTTINVITRAELNMMKEVEVVKPKMKERFKDVQNRFKFVLGSKNSKKQPHQPPQVSIKIPPILLDSTAEPIGKDQMSIKPKRSIKNTQKMERRVSVVGDNLPLYIRDQLRNEEKDQSNSQSKSQQVRGSFENRPKPKTSKSTVPKRLTRLQNLLSNSQTLYAHSKDIPSMTSTNSSHTNTPETIETTRNNFYTDEEDGNLLEELLRYYGVQLEDADDDDNILNELEEEDDANFVDVNESYDVLNGRDKTETNDEDDDEYLFKI
jgi:hypothetical protein